MRKAELMQLVGYTDYVWGEFRRAVPESHLSIVAEGSGWPTLRHCFIHMLAAYERWLPAIVDLKTGAMPKMGNEDLVTWVQIDAERSRLRAELDSRLAGWSDEELAVIREMNIDGETVRYSRGELVAHLMLHERGHHGDLTTLMWQLGLGADMPIEYRFFLGRHSG